MQLYLAGSVRTQSLAPTTLWFATVGHPSTCWALNIQPFIWIIVAACNCVFHISPV